MFRQSENEIMKWWIYQINYKRIFKRLTLCFRIINLANNQAFAPLVVYALKIRHKIFSAFLERADEFVGKDKALIDYASAFL